MLKRTYDFMCSIAQEAEVRLIFTLSDQHSASLAKSATSLTLLRYHRWKAQAKPMLLMSLVASVS